ncbi:MAG: helix-turn-helix transcriptional regulator [Desulforhopalus sp.]
MSLLERIFYFHQEILKENYPNSTTITEQFEVSLATSRRDISYLRDRLLAPLAFDQKKNGFYYLEEGFQLPFSDSPRILFLLAILNKLAGEAGLGGIKEVNQLKKRLAKMISTDHQKITEALFCRWIEIETIDPQVFEVIIDAVVRQRVVRLHYKPIGSTPGERSVAPLQIINYQGRWYLYSYCMLRQANRLFHLGRVICATLTSTPIPAEITLNHCEMEQSFGIFHGKPRYLAEIFFTSTAAELVANQHWHKDQEVLTVEDGILLRLPVNDVREIMMKILQYGAMARVISPPELRDRVHREIIAMATTYENNKFATCDSYEMTHNFMK